LTVAERTEPSESPVSAYRADGVTVFFDVQRCAHFAECVRGLPEVFDVNQRPWIQPSGAPAELVAEVVRRCPTGALHYELHDRPGEAPDRPTHIHAVADGPIMLRGELRIDTPAGEIADVRAALCRCGLTANQPFCDQECKRAGWKSQLGGDVPQVEPLRR
jgi:uncharacterized Fe-S cluster protein YjdI/CDGSH-type Zn-finger protein